MAKYNEVVAFIQINHRNPSRHRDVSFGRVGSIAVQVADDGVDLNDDVLEMRILFNVLNKNS